MCESQFLDSPKEEGPQGSSGPVSLPSQRKKIQPRKRGVTYARLHGRLMAVMDSNYMELVARVVKEFTKTVVGIERQIY